LLLIADTHGSVQTAFKDTEAHNRDLLHRRTLHGAINLTTGTWHHHVSVENVSEVFCYFLQTLLDTYPGAPVVAVICDNGGTHHRGITRRWRAAHPRLMLIEGAKYSPQDNPSNASGPGSNATSC
jgi:hypothetical protein